MRTPGTYYTVVEQLSGTDLLLGGGTSFPPLPTIPASAIGYIQATADPGDVVTGGGFIILGPPLLASAPAALVAGEPTAWAAYYSKTHIDGASAVMVYAVCLAR